MLLVQCIVFSNNVRNARRQQSRGNRASPADWRARAADASPVGRATEIDQSFNGKQYGALVEAKLGSDISLRTTRCSLV
jgi:hypothetical protein